MEKPKDTTLMKWSKLTSWDRIDWCHGPSDMSRKTTSLLWFFCPKYQTNFNMRAILQNNWPVILKNVSHDRQKQEKLRIKAVSGFIYTKRSWNWMVDPQSSLKGQEGTSECMGAESQWEAIPLLPQGLHTSCSLIWNALLQVPAYLALPRVWPALLSDVFFGHLTYNWALTLTFPILPLCCVFPSNTTIKHPTVLIYIICCQSIFIRIEDLTCSSHCDWFRDGQVTHSDSIRRNKILLEYWETNTFSFSVGLEPMRV